MGNPKIRFKKKDGSKYRDWSDKSFDTLFEEYVVSNDGSHMQYTAGKYGLKLMDEEKVRYDISKHKQFNPNSLILGIGIDEVGVSVAETGCVSPIYTTFAINNSNVDTKFIDYYIKGVLYKNKGKITHKSTRRDFEFETKELHKLEIPVPVDIEEQTKIANFLSEIDNLIESAENEVEVIKQLKKAMLQKMFPKKGEKVPEVRFPGFTDAWEQRKLGGEATEILAGGDIDKDKVVENGKYPIYANALTNDGIVGYYDDYFRVKAPAVTVTGRGEVGHAQARMTDFTPVVRLLAIRSNHDCYFLENAINNQRVIVESTGVPQLTVPQLSSYDIFFPKDLAEERKIGEYFHSLDNLITLHQRKVDVYKKFKKAMLQKMFV